MTARRIRSSVFRAILYGIYLLAFFELAARILLSIGPVSRVLKGRDDESSSRLNWVERHRIQQGFGGQYTFDVHDSERGWAVKPNLRQLSVFEGKILNTNVKGIRGQVDYAYPRKPGTTRIVTLGDSYTFGDEVSDDETYSFFLERALPSTEVLNLGVHGYGQDQMLLYLEHEGFKYQPDVVILGYVWFDMFRNLFAFTNYSKPKFEVDGGTLRLTNVPVPPPERLLDREPYRSKAYDLGVMFYERVRWRIGWNRAWAETLTRAILDRLVSDVRQHRAVPLLVYLPVIEEMANAQTDLTPNEQWLRDYCSARGVDCLFLRSRFVDGQRHGQFYDPRHHWFANGHRTAAEGIRDYLVAKGLVH